jgi:hypothetical protein
MRSWKSQSSTWRCTPGKEFRVMQGGKDLVGRQWELQAVPHEETVGEQDQGQVPMQSFPTASLEVIQTTFLFGILIKLLNHPAGVGQRDEVL